MELTVHYGVLWGCHSTLSWSMNSQNTSWYSSLKSISILSSHIHTGLLNGLFPSCFPIRTLQNYIHSHACHIPYPFSNCSLIPYNLTSSINYKTPHYASFSSHFLSLQLKHYSHHSVLKQNWLINGKKHSSVFSALLYVSHIMHFLTIYILTYKMD
jgi:hypothetical protein